MSSRVRTQYRAEVIAANGTFTSNGQAVGAFLPTVSGTLTLATLGTGARTIINAIPVTAGLRLDLEILVEQAQGYTVVLAGGAAGTILI
jgi:hypothetical protein